MALGAGAGGIGVEGIGLGVAFGVGFGVSCARAYELKLRAIAGINILRVLLNIINSVFGSRSSVLSQ